MNKATLCLVAYISRSVVCAAIIAFLCTPTAVIELSRKGCHQWQPITVLFGAYQLSTWHMDDRMIHNQRSTGRQPQHVNRHDTHKPHTNNFALWPQKLLLNELTSDSSRVLTFILSARVLGGEREDTLALMLLVGEEERVLAPEETREPRPASSDSRRIKLRKAGSDRTL